MINGSIHSVILIGMAAVIALLLLALFNRAKCWLLNLSERHRS
ncbi:MAG: hypothetical protein PUB14_01835 [Lachnospiraceae bacterium]|jgi:hypothetical protein|nr:hypothetical protein [Lachnospiraceae bacterium]